MAKTICLVTPGHISSTPRVVKEAEALAAAGHEVTLVSSQHHAPAEPFDEPILRRSTWRNVRVRSFAGPQTFFRKILRRGLRQLIPKTGKISLRAALTLHHPGLHTLVRAAIATEADFYHGHCVAGLAVAALAAQHRGVRYGFDAEDFHEAETDVLERDSFERTIVTRIAAAYLPQAKLRTAAAPLIATAYQERYGVQMETLLNVFPRRDAPAGFREVGAPTRETPAKLYWFSQTIGPGRGLEQMIGVVGMMRTPAELHLRGSSSPDYRRHLEAAAAKVGRPGIVKLAPPASPDEMARLAADAHLGLSLEERQPRNRDLCLTNKVFMYALAGIPQLLSSTSAQRAIAADLGAAALVGDFAAPQQVASQLDEFLADASRMNSSRRHAWMLGQSRFCWDVEQQKLLSLVANALGVRA